MLLDADIEDLGGNSVGKVGSIEMTKDKLIIVVDALIEDDEDDPDPGEEVDPDDTVPIPEPLRLVGNGGISGG